MPYSIDTSDSADIVLDRMLEQFSNLIYCARQAVPGPEGECLDKAAAAIQFERDRRLKRKQNGRYRPASDGTFTIGDQGTRSQVDGVNMIQRVDPYPLPLHPGT